MDKSDPIYSNDIREAYYKVADNLPELVGLLKLASTQRSKVAAKELKIFRRMLDELHKSGLGSIL
jgi:hypothetical protein